MNARIFPFAERRTYIEETDTALIGVQVQEMELAMREATEQQRQLGKTVLRGNHRHAQHGFNYYLVCIDCTKNTPMDFACSKYGGTTNVRKAVNRFFRECNGCKHSELYHENVPLGSLFE